MDDSNKQGLIDLTGFEDIKKQLREEKNSNDEFITQFEFGKWMIEGKIKIKLVKFFF